MCIRDSTRTTFEIASKRLSADVINLNIQASSASKGESLLDTIDNATRFADIGALLDEWKPARLVVGLPMHPDGAEHEMTARARKFANQLHGRFNLPVELVDERYSSAVISAKRGEVIDDRAAAIILQQYFDAT